MCIMRPAGDFPQQPRDSLGVSRAWRLCWQHRCGLQPEQILLCPLSGTNVIICSLEAQRMIEIA